MYFNFFLIILLIILNYAAYKIYVKVNKYS